MVAKWLLVEMIESTRYISLKNCCHEYFLQGHLVSIWSHQKEENVIITMLITQNKGGYSYMVHFAPPPYFLQRRGGFAKITHLCCLNH